MLYQTIHMHGYDQRKKAKSWKTRKEPYQKRLIRIVETFLIMTLPSSTVCAIICLSVSLTALFLPICNTKGPAFTYHRECTAVGHDGKDDDNILAVEQAQRHRRKVTCPVAAQRNTEMLSAAQPKEDVKPHIKITAVSLSLQVLLTMRNVTSCLLALILNHLSRT